ncbi:MAG: hypothetical protein H0T79_15900 [Deltaproteobacteria bacterium]|nr:hypothetical protein [Deltaproteobacteria bacterium]
MKASKRRARARTKSKSPKLTSTEPQRMAPAFSEAEEAFFREGLALSAAPAAMAVESFADLEDHRRRPSRPSLWSRLFARSSAQTCAG